MRKKHPRLFGILWFLCVLAVLGLLFAAAFYATDFFYRATRWSPPAALVQVINSFLGLAFTYGLIRLFARFFRIQQSNAFQPIIHALERIARGDFSIRLEDEHEDGILHGLVQGVNQMARDLGQMETMRQEFVSNVSHEIQSPLTSIRGFAQALRDERLGPAQRLHYLEIIEMESNRLSRLADDLLKLASLDAGQIPFERQPYRLDKQICSVLLTCEPQWRDKSIDIEVVLDEFTLQADAGLLNQVWMNLLHNSIKFTPPGGSIRLSLHSQGGWAQFEITDSGMGISAEDQVHIFERFYKADKARTCSTGGSGLGLAIVKKIVEMHQGRIELASELGKGTTFTVSLPLE